MASTLLVALEHGIKRLTINRPDRRNAVDEHTAEMLLDAIRASADDGTRVIVLTGSGDSFCAGADLNAAQSMKGAGVASDVTSWLRDLTNPTILAMREVPVPIIARVHGPAMGLGFSYVLASDIVIAADNATFAQAFVKVGLMPDGGSSYFLPRLIGHHRAFELMVTGDVLHAEQAAAYGIVNHVVPPAALDGVVAETAKRLAHGPREAIAAIKSALALAESAPLADVLDHEAVHQGDCARSPNFAEGVAAFMEKRKAVFH
jgi:2-(1,2-epoxy-1,2-dihydrophenyl)acetyl-CoA isomerase